LRNLIIFSAFLGAFLPSTSVFASCIPSKEASINGYLPGVQARGSIDFHSPVRVSTTTGEDDGGTYSSLNLDFEGYQVSIVRGVIDSVTIRSPKIQWAKGISIGTKKMIVEQKLGYANVSDTKKESNYLVCSSAGDVYAIARFADDVLIEIELMLDRP